jgi:hypothetical protein
MLDFLFFLMYDMFMMKNLIKNIELNYQGNPPNQAGFFYDFFIVTEKINRFTKQLSSLTGGYFPIILQFSHQHEKKSSQLIKMKRSQSTHIKERKMNAMKTVKFTMATGLYTVLIIWLYAQEQSFIVALMALIALTVCLMILNMIVNAIHRSYLFESKKNERAKALEAIRTYEFPVLVKNRVMLDNKLSEEQFEHLARGMKQYFAICAYEIHSGTLKNKKILMPSRIVDELWHEFILSTRDYKKFCDTVFNGTFLHHLPAGTSEIGDESKALKHTYRTAEKIMEYGLNWTIKGVLTLFALDSWLEITNGFIYGPNEMAYLKTEVEMEKKSLDADNYSSGDSGYFNAWLWSSSINDNTSYNEYVSCNIPTTAYSVHSMSYDTGSSTDTDSSSSSHHSCSSHSCSSSSCSSSSCSSSSCSSCSSCGGC